MGIGVGGRLRTAFLAPLGFSKASSVSRKVASTLLNVALTTAGVAPPWPARSARAESEARARTRGKPGVPRNFRRSATLFGQTSAKARAPPGPSASTTPAVASAPWLRAPSTMRPSRCSSKAPSISAAPLASSPLQRPRRGLSKEASKGGATQREMPTATSPTESKAQTAFVKGPAGPDASQSLRSAEQSSESQRAAASSAMTPRAMYEERSPQPSAIEPCSPWHSLCNIARCSSSGTLLPLPKTTG
mmetsp:Transcript_36000/g.116466  ORF Transcript_36000/g.116466 Transcript_36000/m.116466 type:complete len:247 (+) Transcript_36000:1585-2325(+)